MCRVLPPAVAAQLQRLREREEVRFGSDAGVCVDASEVCFRFLRMTDIVS